MEWKEQRWTSLRGLLHETLALKLAEQRLNTQTEQKKKREKCRECSAALPLLTF
jgi:hypothetical protein